MRHIHNTNKGYETITAETATPEQLFELAHEVLGRVMRLEWVFSCSLMLLLEERGIISGPEDPQAFKDTLAEVHDWLHHYQEDLKRIDRDRRVVEFMDSPE